MKSNRQALATPPVPYSKQQGDKMKVNGVFADETNLGEVTKVTKNRATTYIYLSCYDNGNFYWSRIGAVTGVAPFSHS